MPCGLQGSLSRQQADREAADYESAAVFTRGMADESLAAAERFLGAVRAIAAESL